MDDRLEVFKNNFPELEKEAVKSGRHYRSIEIVNFTTNHFPDYVVKALAGARLLATELKGHESFVSPVPGKRSQRDSSVSYSVSKKNLLVYLRNRGENEAYKFFNTNLRKGYGLDFRNEEVTLVD